MKHLKRISSLLLALALFLSMAVGLFAPADTHADGLGGQSIVLQAKKKKPSATPTGKPKATPSAKPAATAKPTAAPTETPAGPIIEPQAIADYIFEHGCLPDNFITKRQAQDLGWDSYRNYVSDVAPGKSIGGDRFGNYEGQLPKAKGRQYYEADCYYTRGKRNAYRIIFSNDGLVYYTADHYTTFTQMFPSWENKK